MVAGGCGTDGFCPPGTLSSFLSAIVPISIQPSSSIKFSGVFSYSLLYNLLKLFKVYQLVYQVFFRRYKKYTGIPVVRGIGG